MASGARPSRTRSSSHRRHVQAARLSRASSLDARRARACSCMSWIGLTRPRRVARAAARRAHRAPPLAPTRWWPSAHSRAPCSRSRPRSIQPTSRRSRCRGRRTRASSAKACR
eukprot:1580526-Prymnesium_polylepis.1